MGLERLKCRGFLLPWGWRGCIARVFNCHGVEEVVMQVTFIAKGLEGCNASVLYSHGVGEVVT